MRRLFMHILEVLNVGQGDCAVIKTPEGCDYEKEDIFVDLGPGNYDITQQLEKDYAHIFITHNHYDHLGGMKFFVDKFDRITEITLPLFQNEISLIAKTILNLKSIKAAEDCSEFVRFFRELTDNQYFLKTLSHKLNVSFAYEGKSFCKHIFALNPPLTRQSIDWLSNIPEEQFKSYFSELFNEEFAAQLLGYIKSAQQNRKYDGMDFILTREQTDELPHDINKIKGNVVVSFIIENICLLRQFNNEPNRNNMGKIYDNYGNYTHDYCTVLRLSYNYTNFLLTGDASKKVFRRLIDSGCNIQADYLKMPHHGSSNNIDADILDAINPKVAIISHKNGKFGKAEDPHPNIKTIDLLRSRNIDILVTNDVKKSDKNYCIKKANNKPDSNVKIY